MHIQHIESTSGHTGNISGIPPSQIKFCDVWQSQITFKIKLYKGTNIFQIVFTTFNTQ
jgi:hypothetical protein